ncbi:DUF6221 family protein [Kitasatospora kifunensis]|uniref:Uncharacterized protein n=1 Tax=Kitasatospora kifunensis TaxID=58351 RepID=A0A7W7QZ84_KITKI|nr:DUF6221 family protein [Kitasatospora kifunensis]MBB4922253.1 hypothetical protein [Kitasatospora kifunensis]
MTDDLVAFLRERLDEAEAVAKKDIWAADNATTGNWRAHYGENLPYSLIKAGDSVLMRVESEQHQADVLLAARFKPDTVRARACLVLAEVEAKRSLIDRYENHRVAHDHHVGGILTKYLVAELRTALRALALPYREHPNYRSEWAPDA